MFKKYLNKSIFTQLIFIYKLIGINNFNKYFNIKLKQIEKIENKYITIHKRPILTSNIKFENRNFKPLPKHAIVIQGQILIINDFTFETIKLYKRTFKNTSIILSTWSDTPDQVLNKFKDLNIHILLNDKPLNKGISNINLQIVTSGNGIKYAKNIGSEFVFKTRTDQRMYENDLNNYFFNLINQFPLKLKNSKQNKRIISISLNTFRNRMFGVTDMLNYGHIDDMLIYWNPKLDDRLCMDESFFEKTQKPSNYAHLNICEVYLVTNFLKNTGYNFLWTIEDSLKTISNLFCIVDKESVDLYWGKYSSLEYQWKEYEIDSYSFEEIHFKDWLNLFYNYNNTDLNE